MPDQAFTDEYFSSVIEVMKITNLMESPHLKSTVLKIVEEEFNYPSDQDMTVDFSPLFQESNLKNCFVLLKDEKAIGHIGLREVNFQINGMLFSIAFIGAIAITKEEQGNGYFSSFFKEVLELNNHYPLFFLWSDNHDLYKKFSFLPAIGLNVYAKTEKASSFPFKRTLLKDLNESERNEILELYKNCKTISPYRTTQSLSELEKVTSSDLYLLKEDNKIVDYFFVGKGADLNEIIHESHFKNIDHFQMANSKFECWTTKEYSDLSFDLVASTLIKAGEINKLSELIAHYTKGLIGLRFIKGEKVEFEFEGKLLKLNLTDFLQGVFGPSQFEEIKNLKPFFIPGLDSI